MGTTEGSSQTKSGLEVESDLHRVGKEPQGPSSWAGGAAKVAASQVLPLQPTFLLSCFKKEGEAVRRKAPPTATCLLGLVPLLVSASPALSCPCQRVREETHT